MQKRTTILAIILIVVAALVVVLTRGGAHDIIDSSVETPDAAIKIYLEAMIPHHQEAVDSSFKVISDQAINDTELKIMAGRIYDAQTFEIVQMKSWYADWFGQPYSSTTTLWKGVYMPMMTKTMTAGTPDEIREAYLDEMIDHHKMAIDMSKGAKKALAKLEEKNIVTDGDLTISDANPIFEQARGFMQRVVDAQSKEIEQLSSLQK